MRKTQIFSQLDLIEKWSGSTSSGWFGGFADIKLSPPTNFSHLLLVPLSPTVVLLSQSSSLAENQNIMGEVVLIGIQSYVRYISTTTKETPNNKNKT